MEIENKGIFNMLELKEENVWVDETEAQFSFDRLYLIYVELIARIWVPAVAKACLQMTKLLSWESL